MRKIKAIEGWADVGSHGGIFVNMSWNCPECKKTGRKEQAEGKFAIYETEMLALRAGVSNPVKVKIVNTK